MSDAEMYAQRMDGLESLPRDEEKGFGGLEGVVKCILRIKEWLEGALRKGRWRQPESIERWVGQSRRLFSSYSGEERKGKGKGKKGKG